MRTDDRPTAAEAQPPQPRPEGEGYIQHRKDSVESPDGEKRTRNYDGDDQED